MAAPYDNIKRFNSFARHSSIEIMQLFLVGDIVVLILGVVCVRFVVIAVIIAAPFHGNVGVIIRRREWLCRGDGVAGAPGQEEKPGQDPHHYKNAFGCQHFEAPC